MVGSSKKYTDSSVSPRRRPSVGGRISISWKLFAYLVVFAAFMLAVVWLMQIGLLNYFYSQSKQKEMDIADQMLTEAVKENPSVLEEVAETCAMDYLLCIRVFRLEGTKAHQVVSERISNDCLIHRISDRYLTELYNQAVGNGGVYTKQISPQSLFLADPDALVTRPGGDALVGGQEDFRNLFRNPQLDQKMNMIRVRVITGDLGEQYILLLNSELEPLNATVETLKAQFWVIAFILLWGGKQGYPNEDGLYCNCACGYLIKPKKVGYLGTTPPEYFMIFFDETGVAKHCCYEKVV